MRLMRLSAYLCMLIEFGLILGPMSTLLLPGAGDPLNGQKSTRSQETGQLMHLQYTKWRVKCISSTQSGV